MNFTIPTLALILAGGLLNAAAGAPKPLKALLLTGGCCHDYAAQKDFLKKGIEARAHVIVDQIHVDDASTSPPLPIFGNADYAAGYDVVIHDACAAGISDAAVVAAILAPHRKGLPGVNLHCAMHSYRIGDFRTKAVSSGSPSSMWFEYLGLQSTGHGNQSPIEIKHAPQLHPITLPLVEWSTGDEELYNNVHLYETASVLSNGRQGTDTKIVTWTNDYQGTKVFSTSLGHNNATVADPRYLDLVTRGLLWATGKLDDKGKITDGYGPKP